MNILHRVLFLVAHVFVVGLGTLGLIINYNNILFVFVLLNIGFAHNEYGKILFYIKELENKQ